MRRGKKAIIAITDTEVKQTFITAKGRSATLIRLRNELLLARYYYYNVILKMKYDDTLRMLEDDFFLSQNTIANTLSGKLEELRAIHKEKPGVKWFKEKWPRWPWRE
jgi:hypothetical protein